jgi:hypothetical protein
MLTDSLSACGAALIAVAGLRDGLVSIFRSDGYLGLYRGLAPNLMASGVSWGVYFFSYNHAKNFWRANLLAKDPSAPQSSSKSPVRLGPLAHLACAAFSGTCATLCTNPFSMVKTRLQLQGKEITANGRVYKGVFDAFTRIVREEGFATLYRGIGPSLILVSNGALQFMSYEELKRLAVTHLIATHEERELHAAHFMCMGALAKVFSATVTYPMAVTRARLYQRQPDDMLLARIERGKPVPAAAAAALAPTVGPLPGAGTGVGVGGAMAVKSVDGKYNGMLDVISKIWRREGWRGFYRGLTPMLIKVRGMKHTRWTEDAAAAAAGLSWDSSSLFCCDLFFVCASDCSFFCDHVHVLRDDHQIVARRTAAEEEQIRLRRGKQHATPHRTKNK